VKVYLSLGSNLGERLANLERAIKLLAEKVELKRVSSFYETEPIGYPDQPRFLNAVIEVATSLGPLQILSLVKGIEVTMGRETSFRNAPRPIDVDILFYGERVIETPQLEIPHPRLAERAFVLIPLAEIAPDLVHPVSGKTVRELAVVVEGQEGVRKYERGERSGNV